MKINNNNNGKIEISRPQPKTSNLETLKPLIFTKKVNDKSKLIPLNATVHQLGQTRHFPPANKEWSNSIYAYNNNSVKSLPAADKSLNNLINSYFNFFPSQSVLKSKRLRLRFRRLSHNKVFLSKAELKHTSNKVIITLYVYNEERRLLISKMKKLEYLIPSNILLKKKDRPWSIKEKLLIVPKWNSLFEEQAKKVELLLDNYNEIINIFNEANASFNNSLFFNIMKESLGEKLMKEVLEQLMSIKKYLDKLMPWIADDNYVMKKVFEEELMFISYHKPLLLLNSYKFEERFISKLSYLTSKIYNKEVEFNIVNLKTLYLNSDIFTQAIALKLKNRDNRLLRVLRSSLYMVKLPKINRIIEKYGKGKKEQLSLASLKAPNNITNLKAKSIFDKNITKDSVNQLLLDIFPYEKKVNKFNTTGSVHSKTLSNIILNSLKHKSMAGVRLEAAGRLTRRFTASRSVFKIRWKGSLKNIDSSYRGLSSVILRGHAKSNVQYSIINSKTRNGAFGIRGWVSSK